MAHEKTGLTRCALVATVMIVLLGKISKTDPVPQKCGGKADILFILDSSASIGLADYERQLEFAADVTAAFTIGPNDVLFSVIVFSSTSDNVFGFQANQTSQEVKQKILNLPYLKQATDTGAALSLARNYSFTSANGARTDAAKIAIVITDGLSNNKNKTIREASLLQQSITGVSVICIGVGNRVDNDEINDIASSPSLVFLVNDYRVLQAVRSQLSQTVCEEQTIQLERNTSCVIDNVCVGKADGRYRACTPECQAGLYYNCSNELAYRMSCPLGSYTALNGTRFTAPQVYVVGNDRCELEAEYCPRNTLKYVVYQQDSDKTGERPCIANDGDCVGKPNRNYPKCFPECQKGYYVTCSNNRSYDMPCPLGWYVDKNNNTYLDRMVYNPPTDTCELTSRSCYRDPKESDASVRPFTTQSSRNLPNPETGERPCIANDGDCVGKPNGNYPKCFPECRKGYYVTCSNNRSYDVPCPKNWYIDKNNNTYLDIMVYNPPTDTCELASRSCPREPKEPVASVKPPTTEPGRNVPDPATPQCHGKADILLILDSSGSIGQDNYDVMISFVSDLTQSFTVGPQDVLFSALIFSDNTINLFNFSTYSNNKDVSEALKSARYLNGNTDTAEALSYARTYSFASISGARPDTGKVAIVLTDGISNIPPDTAREADLLKKLGVKVFAIGIGPGAVMDELIAIASSASLVYEVENFSVLSAIRNELVTSACDEPINRHSCISNDNSCIGKSNGNYPACSPLCQNGYYYTCSNGFAYKMPCGLAEYTSDNETSFTARMVYSLTSDSCELAVDYCPRDPQDHVVVVPPSPSPAANKTYTPSCISSRESCYGKRNGNYPICYPDCQKGNYYSCSNNETYEMPCPLGWYTDSQQNRFLDKTVYDPVTDSCQLQVQYCPREVHNRPNTDTSPTEGSLTEAIPQCKEKVDLLLVVDSSASIGDINYGILLSFLANLTTHFNVGPDDVLISALVFSSYPSIEFAFNVYRDNSGIGRAILSLPYMDGSTDTAAALSLAIDAAFNTTNGARHNVKKATIVLTDGISNNPDETSREAERLKSSGVTVLAVGIGPNVRDTELQAIASSPSLVFNVTYFNVLDIIVREVVSKACQKP